MGITEAASKSAEASLGAQPSLSTFRDIFNRIEPDVQIDSLELAQGSGRGDNYTATLYRISLTGQRRQHADGKKRKWERSLICKVLPENLQRREAYKSEKLFRNEVEFYTTIMPELLRFQSSKVEESQTFKAIPKCYSARTDLLVMEDLRVRGFGMPDRIKGLTIEETQVVLLQIAQFHALSLAYKFEHPNQFEKLRSVISEGLFCDANASWYKNYYERLTKNAINMVSDVFPEDSKYLCAMRKFAESNSFFSRMVQLVSLESPLSAICHGDCWVNNFLYRYDKDGADSKTTLEVALVDFQLIRYSSIALDIANLLYCCTTKELRDGHLNKLLKLYIDEVFKWLCTLCTQLPAHCDSSKKFEELLAIDLKEYGCFALGLAMDIIPISTCASEDAPDLYLTRADDSDEAAGAPLLNFPPNDLCRQKMSDILRDMVDGEML